ncbi:MAG: DUF1592 domain-containing protein [Opitutaceae bacterium]
MHKNFSEYPLRHPNAAAIKLAPYGRKVGLDLGRCLGRHGVSRIGSKTLLLSAALAVNLSGAPAPADAGLLKTHCADCHNDDKLKGKFSLRMLGDGPTPENVERWLKSLDHVKEKEMPPEDDSHLSERDRATLVSFLTQRLQAFSEVTPLVHRASPRRLNNREFANSVRDVLLIEDVGTHHPTENLLGDTLRHGFDTHGESLGFSPFHVDQYVEALRKIIDATILTGPQPVARRYDVKPGDIAIASFGKVGRMDRRQDKAKFVDFFDPKERLYFSSFETVPATGRYRLKIRATGKDRGIYDAADTGIYPGDPIRLSIHLGDRVRTIDLPDEKVLEIELDEWLAAGTKVQLSYPTDGLRLRANGNFKFEYAIAGEYIKKHDPALYAKVVAGAAKAKFRADTPAHWSHWTNYWQGPRPRLFGAEIVGPTNEGWPTPRQVALLGADPKADNAAAILRPIAERAWRRSVTEEEMGRIAGLVKSRAAALGDIGALKEGIVAILVSPSFLLLNTEAGDPAERFATKFSYFLASTLPDQRTRDVVRAGQLQSFEAVRAEVQRRLSSGEGREFVRTFPYEWLQLSRINFMPPDPERFPFYNKKRVGEDMVNEALAFFRHAIEHNLPLPEFLSADYSFVNADLAAVYQLADVAPDSTLRKYRFVDGRRGGLLGMGAFLTLTGDGLTTSPIHRAIYVMENFLGLHPPAQPQGVKITEPDVRQARTIKQVLAAHTSDQSCAACHAKIDPFGYAFENFDTMGTWRDFYTAAKIQPATEADDRPKPAPASQADKGKKTASKEKKKPGKQSADQLLPVDASAKFRNGTAYRDIVEFRALINTSANQEKFVRCFIIKLLTYANGDEPKDLLALDKIVASAAQNNYRIVDTIAAVVDSPLFREK